MVDTVKVTPVLAFDSFSLLPKGKKRAFFPDALLLGSFFCYGLNSVSHPKKWNVKTELASASFDVR